MTCAKNAQRKDTDKGLQRMEGLSIILHESNIFVRTGITEYLKSYFPQVRVVSSPTDIDDLCDALLSTDFDVILTDILYRMPPLHINQKVIDIINHSLCECRIIFWGVTPAANHYGLIDIKSTTYGLDRCISLKKLHILFHKMCLNENLPEFEIKANNTIKPLSSREFIIIGKLMQEKSINEISADLNINSKTVSTHKRNALKKLNVKSLGSLFLYK